MRNLAIEVAKHVFGYRMETVQPSWYRLPVHCFYVPSDPNWMVYSYDENACNAMMFRDGKSEKSGYARPLPFWDIQLSDAWEVVHALKDRTDGSFERFLKISPNVYELDEETAARRICEAALKAVLNEQSETPSNAPRTAQGESVGVGAASGPPFESGARVGDRSKTLANRTGDTREAEKIRSETKSDATTNVPRSNRV